MKTVILHCGAHKTATSYIQNTLLLSKKKLADNGIAYIPLSIMRTGLTANLMNLNQAPKTTLDSILAVVEDEKFETLIISDENILGGFDDIVKHNKVAPNAAKRLGRLTEVFNDYDLQFYFAIRNQGDYLSSLYCEYLRNSPKYLSFNHFKKEFDYLGFRWSNLIKEFLSEIDSSQLNIFSYESFCKDERDIFNKLVVGKNDLLVDEKNKKSRSSYSNKTIEIIDHLATKFNHHFVLRFIDNIEDKLTELKRNDRFSPWSVSEKLIFDANYDKDKVSISGLVLSNFI